MLWIAIYLFIHIFRERRWWVRGGGVGGGKGGLF